MAPYADAFRQQMVELVVAGRRPMELAREFGCSDGSIHAWVKKAGRVVDLPRGAHVLQAAQSARTNASRMALSTQERDGSVAKFKNSRAESVAIILLRWLTNRTAAPDVLVQRPSIDLCGSCASVRFRSA